MSLAGWLVASHGRFPKGLCVLQEDRVGRHGHHVEARLGVPPRPAEWMDA
jgi:hypothetical protein